MRYLSYEEDFEIFYEQEKTIDLYNYIYDEFNHVLLTERFLPIKKSNISTYDLNNVYRAITDIIETMIYGDDA